MNTRIELGTCNLCSETKMIVIAKDNTYYNTICICSNCLATMARALKQVNTLANKFPTEN